MRHHPLTPMTDPNLVRVLSRQTPHPVGLLDLDVVRAGPAAVGRRLAALADGGVRHVVVDATDATPTSTRSPAPQARCPCSPEAPGSPARWAPPSGPPPR